METPVSLEGGRRVAPSSWSVAGERLARYLPRRSFLVLQTRGRQATIARQARRQHALAPGCDPLHLKEIGRSLCG